MCLSVCHHHIITSVWIQGGDKISHAPQIQNGNKKITHRMFFCHSLVPDSLTIFCIVLPLFCGACQLISNVYWKKCERSHGRKSKKPMDDAVCWLFLFFFYFFMLSGRACYVYSVSFLRLHRLGYCSFESLLAHTKALDL